jgi:hypothetical protein
LESPGHAIHGERSNDLSAGLVIQRDGNVDVASGDAGMEECPGEQSEIGRPCIVSNE